MDYELYFDKQDCILEIKPLKKCFKNIPVTGEVNQYNHCYYFCSNKKLLKEKALELKKQWQLEAKKRLQRVVDIKI